MAGVSIPPGSSLSQQAYRAGLVIEAERAVRAMAFAGTDPNNALVVEEFGGVKRGTNLKIRFRPIKHDTIPKPRATNIVGSETTRDYLEDDISLRYFVLADGAVENNTSDQQNVDFALIENEHISMAREASEIIEKSIMNQLCGYTVVNDTATYPDYGWSGGNIVTNPDTSHHFFAPDSSGTNASESAVGADSTSVLTDRFVEDTVMRLRSLDYVTYPIPPASTPWGELYILFSKGVGMLQVKENSTDSDIYDLSKAAIQGGLDPSLSTLVTGEGFIKGKVLYLESDYCTFGLSGVSAGATTTGTRLGNVNRAVLLGARAMHVVYGEGFVDGLHLGYTEHQVHRRLSMATDTVHGFKAVIVNSQRWASAVLSHYSPVA